jgi:amino acid adenylation domain-containing protein
MESRFGELEIASQHFPEAEAYWTRQLAGSPTKAAFPPDHPTAAPPPEINQYPFSMEPELAAKLGKISGGSGPKLHMLLLTALTILLEKYTGNTDITVGMPIYSQEREAEFINTILPVRTQLEEGMSFKDCLLTIRRTIVEAAEHQNYPIVTLPRKLGFPAAAGEDFPLFDVSILLEDIQQKGYLNQARHNVMFVCSSSSGSIEGYVEYSGHRYSRETIKTIALHFHRVLATCVADIDCPVGEIGLMTAAEEREILDSLDGTDSGIVCRETLPSLVEKQARQTPDHVAVIFRDQQLTYGELERQARFHAHRLRERHIKPGTVVGLLAHRSPEMVVGMLAILKAGAAFLPMDPSYPQARLKYLAKDCGVDIMLTTPGIEHPPPWAAVIPITTIHQEAPPLSLEIDPQHLAYVIYTSGTTGEPKGVMVEHRNVVNVLLWFGREYALAPYTRVLQLTHINFDPCIEQVFGSLVFGAAVCLVDDEQLMDIQGLRALIDRQRINVMNFVPTMLKHILGSGPRLQSLTAVISGGEKLDDPLKESLLAMGYPLYNQYGPTETTIDALQGPCRPGQNSLGKPVANGKILLLTPEGRPALPNVPAELHIGGAGVARGYLNNPELTRRTFIPDPYHPGQRLYKTGDRCALTPEGEIRFLGRMDRQIKIRGNRVEPGEIEGVMMQCPGVQEAAVCLKPLPSTAGGHWTADQLYEKIMEGGHQSNPRLGQMLEEVEAKSVDFHTQTHHCSISARILNPLFIRPPEDSQRNWTVQRTIEEFRDDLHFYHQLIQQLPESPEPENWLEPYTRHIAALAAGQGGDVLLVDFGQGVMASYLLKMGVKSLTVFAGDSEKAERFKSWSAGIGDGVKVQLIEGSWLEADNRLDLYDAIIINVNPLYQEDFWRHIAKQITAAAPFIPQAARHLKPSGILTYFSHEIDSIGRSHQRLLFNYFDQIALQLERPLEPALNDTNRNWWADRMAVVKASKPKMYLPGPDILEEKEVALQSNVAADFDVAINITDKAFIPPPHGDCGLREALLHKVEEELRDDLVSLDKLTRNFVPGSEREYIDQDWKTSDAIYDGSQLLIEDQQVMQDWQHPLMRKLAEIAASSHGHVLEIGFGMGISSTYMLEMGIKAYTVIECNQQVIDHFDQWKKRFPGVDINLIPGKWQEVIDDLGMFDAILFDTYPQDEEEFVKYVVNSVTFAEHFFPTAAGHLKEGGIFTYYTNEIDSFSRRHQRKLLDYFNRVSMEVVRGLEPPADCKNWWADSMAAIKAIK